MPNVMAALSNIGGALCSTPQRLADAVTPTTRVPCSNAAKTRNPLKFAGVPRTNETISAAIYSGPSSPYCEDKCGGGIAVEQFFFPIVDACLSCEDIAPQSCAMVPRWRFLVLFFASCIFSQPHAARFRPAS